MRPKTPDASEFADERLAPVPVDEHARRIDLELLDEVERGMHDVEAGHTRDARSALGELRFGSRRRSVGVR